MMPKLASSAQPVHSYELSKIWAQNSTLSDLAHFWSVDSSGPDESNDAKTSLICPSCS